MFGQVAPDAVESGLVALACGEASGRGSKTGNLTVLKVTNHFLLLHSPAEILEIDVAHVLCAVVLSEEVAAAYGSGSTAVEGHRFHGGAGLAQNLRDRDHLLVDHGSAVLFA